MIRHSVNRRPVMRPSLAVLAAIVAAGSVRADDDPAVHNDDVGDAVLRRTDEGADAPVNPGSNLPDLMAVVLGGWDTATARTNPYSGQWIDPDDTELMRLDIVFKGLFNPPGPINLRGEGYQPYRYGLHPIYGFLEIDLDRRTSTGGEIDGVAHRPLGSAARFGGMLSGSAGENAAITGYDLDGNLLTPPHVERSGEEMHFSLCACHPFTVNTLSDPTPATFDAGDRWILSGRFLPRTQAFSQYSFAIGGSGPGEYDPVIDLLWSHDVSTNRTTLSIVYGLTNVGAAQLYGGTVQGLDGNASNHTSVLEMLDDIRFSAVHTNDPGVGTPFDLLREWRDSNHEDLTEFLDPTEWEILALFGTTYSVQQFDGSLYAWTDVGPAFHRGDLNGDSIVNSADQDVIMSALATGDGSGRDVDGAVNGQIRLVDFGPNFALHDLDYDGVINSLDLAIIGYVRRGDVNSDRLVNNSDLSMLRTMLGQRFGDPLYNPAADLNADLIINWRDEHLLMGIIGPRVTAR